jgi:hypothetical protein
LQHESRWPYLFSHRFYKANTKGGVSMEEWRTIEGFENYMVSNFGRVKSIRYKNIEREKILSQFKRSDGYMSVGMCINGRNYHKTVHRLVAKAFIDNPDGLEMVNHKDENRSNNSVDNLEWCTRSYNQIYSINIHPERKKKFGNNFIKEGKNSSSRIVKGLAHSNFEPIIQKTKNGDFIKRYDNAAQAGKELGFFSGNIYQAAKRNKDGTKIRKRHSKCTSYGFVWEFE